MSVTRVPLSRAECRRFVLTFPARRFAPMLSPADVKRYQDQGYLVVPDVLDAATLAAIRVELARIVDGARAVTAHTDRYDLEPGHRPDDPRVRRIKKPHHFYPVFTELMRHPRLVAVLNALLGPAVRLHGSKINLKSPHYGSPVEWHQDWAFYPHTNDNLLAVGVMLDDCTSDNGPLLVVPGTHRGPTFDHHTGDHHGGRYFCRAIHPAAIPGEIARAVPLTGRAGSMSFHHVRLVHGSAQNVSSLPRTLLLYEYGAADAWPLMGVSNLADFDGRLITGSPGLEPRLVPPPGRMPLAPRLRQGSIYEDNKEAAKVVLAPPHQPLVALEAPHGEVARPQARVDRLRRLEPALHGEQHPGGEDRVEERGRVAHRDPAVPRHRAREVGIVRVEARGRHAR